jgi:hypothetical protein
VPFSSALTRRGDRATLINLETEGMRPVGCDSTELAVRSQLCGTL